MWKLTDEQIEAMTPQRRELIIRPDVVVVTDQAELEGLSIVRLGASPIESAPAVIALVVPVPGMREKQHLQRDRAAIASDTNTHQRVQTSDET